jgi:hypothetical protein
VLKLDPRIKTPAAGLGQLATLTREMYDDARTSHQAYDEAREMVEKLDATSPGTPRSTLEAIAPAPSHQPARRGRGARGTAPEPPPTLNGVSDELLAAAMAMQGADVTPTASQVAACARARTRYRAVMARWNAVAGKER